MTTERAFNYLKSEIRRAARLNGTVSAVDVRNVMRKYFSGSSRGAWVTNAFRDLISKGFLVYTSETTYNPYTHHQVAVYDINDIS